MAAPLVGSRDLQLQQQIGAAPAGLSNIAKVASQIGGQLAQLGSQQRGAQVARLAGQGEQQRQLQISGQKEQLRQRIVSTQAGLAETAAAAAGRLAQIDQAGKKEMFDARKTFAEDNLGKKFSNERQLADYVKLTSARDEDFRNFQQNLEVAHDRKKQALSTALDRISSTAKFEADQINTLREQMTRFNTASAEYRTRERLLSQRLAQEQRLRELEVSLRRGLASDAAKAQNRAMMFQAIGTITGAVAGGFLGAGAPMGVAAGASVGSAVGGGLGTLATRI